MKTNKLMIILTGMIILGVWAHSAQALKPPHSNTQNYTVLCSSCHKHPLVAPPGFYALTSFDNMCFNAQTGCHVSSPGAKPDGSKKKFEMKNASNRFKNIPRGSSYYVNYSTNKKQSSHGWKIPNTNAAAGATNNWAPMREYGDSTYLNLKNRIYCTRCHRAHGDTGPNGEPIYKSYFKADPTGDYLCFQCHASRRIGDATNTNVEKPLPSSISFTGSNGVAITVQPHYSHPVEVNYSSARAKPGKSALFFKNPTSSFPANASAKLKLYTTKGGVNGAVVCSTCHGPLHSADSNPYTFDSLSSYSRTGNYSSSEGNLLRRYPMKKSDDMCLSCHKVTTHQTFKCNRCHAPHKKAGENNRYLILENISTPNSNIRPVQFISTSEMADRWSNQGVGGISNAICQVCHTATKWHRNYSTVGPTGLNRSGHATPDEYLGSLKYRACIACHGHGSGFSPAGSEACGSCHNAQLSDTNGKHVKHVGTATYTWSDGTLGDARTASSYGFSCGRCHSAWTPYTGDIRHKSPKQTYYNYSGDSKLKVYTADLGFKRKGILPNNTTGSYTYGATGGYDDGSAAGGSRWRYPNTGASDGKCSNLYCHGQFFNGYTSNDPTWRNVSNAQVCGSCHGVAQELGKGIPGKTGSVSYGAHQRHVGAGTQEYGQTGGTFAPRFRCNACHNATSGMNNATTLNKLNHVNGRTNVQFDAAYSYSASTYGGFNFYSGRTNLKTTPKTVYQTCSKIYCHSDATRLSNFSASNHQGAWKFPNWSSSKNFTTTVNDGGRTRKMRCTRCHGSTYGGITAGMPEYASRVDKGNSHKTHVIDNGFLCIVCHSKTVNADNKSILFTYSAHINQRYDVDIKTSYGGTYNSSTHKCSNVECHALKDTPAWGTPANCGDCHYSTGDTDKRIRPRSKFTGYTSAVPKIYSAQWADRGHGRDSATQYDKNTNYGAQKACTICHVGTGTTLVTTKHGTSTNPFRLYTAPDRPNVVCNKCHGVGGSGATRTGIQTHASSVTQGANRHNYEMKCIDCHDPHGDNNIFMLHSTLPRPGGISTMPRDMASGRYGTITSVSDTQSNVDFVNNVYTTDYAKKTQAPRVCQVCHDETHKPLSTLGYRYQYNRNGDTKHGSDKCTGCHQHAKGFKGAGCNSCHGNPPEGTKSILGGLSTTNMKTPSGVPNAGAHVKHISVYGNSGTTCAKCHQGGMYDSGTESTDIDLGFSAFDLYTGAGQKYTGTAAVRGTYNYAGTGITTGDTMRCNSMKCHGGGTSQWLTKNFGTPTAPEWYTPATATCGKCHGAKKTAGSGSWPTTKAHAKHVGTDSTPATIQYDFMCKLCHNTTVLTSNTTLDDNVHVNGQANFAFNSAGDNRVDAGAYNGDTNVNSGFGKCLNTYCHSRGTSMAPPYDTTALANYTANWNDAPVSNRCKYCHGNRVLNGITAAMPDQVTGNSHRRHVVTEKFRCSFCHANVVNDSGQIVSKTNHVNKFKNISIPKTYKTSYEGYSSLVPGKKTCKNVKCHGGRTTPLWGNTANCSDCHYRANSGSDADADSFTFQYYTGQTANAAKIYSGEWTKRGHGKTKVSGKYPFSNNTGAGKNCDICHTKAEQHNSGNYFRIRTTATNTTYDPDKLCAQCHGTGTQLGKLGAGTFGRITGIVSHTYNNMSTLGDYNGGTSPNTKANWSFTPKCVDCHDPHGDNNNAMLHKFVNMTGSDSLGRPANPPTWTVNNNAVAQVTYTAVGGAQIGWSSFVRSGSTPYTGICQRCHSAEVYNFDKAEFNSSHQNGSPCKNCHKHKKGFAPSGCDSCHAYPPPKGPLGQGWTNDSLTNRSSLHIPHAWNVRARPGIPTAENTQNSGSIPSGQRGYLCNRCHDGAEGTGSDGTSSDHMTPAPTKANATMKNMTMVYGDWSPGAMSGYQSVADDTCRNIRCHTPRSYPRAWKKPGDCDDCHGYRNGSGYQNISSGSHKMHTYSGIAGSSYKYKFACTQCHVNNQSNFSTHYTGNVDMGFNVPPFGLATATDYGRGTSFKGYTTTNNFKTCTASYCHGANFAAGAKGTVAPMQTPTWGGTAPCGSCHKTDNTISQGAHQKHVAAPNNIRCPYCHASETASTHVNGSVTFNDGNTLAATSVCANCHFNGAAAVKSSWASPSTQTCDTCHFNTADANEWNAYTNMTSATKAAARINQKQYTSVGHGKRNGNYFSGRAGANKVCSNCHDSAANHGDAANPFRLISSNTTLLCSGCHTSGIFGHNSSVTAGRYGFDIKCVDCHDPHGDNNIFMVHSSVAMPASGNNYTPSDQYGKPKAGVTFFNVDFTNNVTGTDYGKTTEADNITTICNACHVRTTNPPTNSMDRYRQDMATSPLPTDTHYSDKCTGCHAHSAGFEGAGESTGGKPCTGCHDLFTRMQNDTNFHHVMSTYSAVFKQKTSFGTTDTAAKERRCLMCHVDHDAFNPAVKSRNKRAANLRRNAALLTNNTGFATDFWPAKRGGSGAGSYAETKPISGPSTSNGVCISCHIRVQSKNTTLQIGNQGGAAPSFTLALYTSSSHNFQIISGMNKFVDGSRFRANCSKCHGSYYINKQSGNQGQQGSREMFGLHDSKYQSLNRPLGGNTTVVAPYYSKDLCFNCHSKDLRKSYDYYSSVKMGSGAKLIKAADEGKSYRHPVGGNSGGHRPDEYTNAGYGWNVGATRHVECVDCHNTHGGNAAVTRDPGSAVATGGPNGNKISGAQYGVWGIQTSGYWPAVGAQPSYRKVQQVTYQYELCAKCHSKFAWNTYSAPDIPSGGGPLTDIMKEINPKNHGFHPIAAVGKLQPAIGLNPKWPTTPSKVKYYDPFKGITAFAGRSGFDWTFVPPYGRRSTLACTDCHKADSTGLAIADYKVGQVNTVGSWSNATVVSLLDIDSQFATSINGGTAMAVDVTGPGGFATASDMNLAVYARQNIGKNKVLNYNVKVSGVSAASGTITLPNKSTSFAKYAVNIYAGMSGQSCLTPTCLENNVTVELSDAATATPFDVTKVSVEAIYPFTEPLRGPHGSMQKWLLASKNNDIWVDWDGNLAYTSAQNEKINVDGVTPAVGENNTFCFNCHRRDVYNLGDGAGGISQPAHTDHIGNNTADYARFKHATPSQGGGPSQADVGTGVSWSSYWGIGCMNCHGGGRAGAIHGDWHGTSWGGYSLTNRPAGVRLLNGGSTHIEAVTNATAGGTGVKCYTVGAGITDPYVGSLGTCASTHTPKSQAYSDTYNYSYTAY